MAVVRVSPLRAPPRHHCGALGGLMLSQSRAPRCGVVVGFGLFNPPRPHVVWRWVLGY